MSKIERIPQGTAIRVPLKARLASNHESPATGKTLSVALSKNMAAFGNPNAGATNATEAAAANGWYYVDLVTADVNTLGPLVVRATGPDTDPVEVRYEVVAAGGSPAPPVIARILPWTSAP